MKLIRFKEFLVETAYQNPYYKSSKFFRKALSEFTGAEKTKILEKIKEFKKLKTLKPQDLIKSPVFKDHTLNDQLNGYCDAHLIFGSICLIYKHFGRYLLLLDIVPHKVLENPKLSGVLAIKYKSVVAELSKEVEDKLKKWDEKN